MGSFMVRETLGFAGGPRRILSCRVQGAERRCKCGADMLNLQLRCPMEASAGLSVDKSIETDYNHFCPDLSQYICPSRAGLK